MSLHTDRHVHHFLANKEMNHMYISYGLLSFSLGLISIFVPIYLYELGYSIPWILFYFLLVSLSFIIFSFWGAKITEYLGVKRTMFIAMPILLLYFIGLRFMPNWSVLFFILPFLRSFKMIFYNYSFHLNFIEHADKKDIGKEVSMIHASALAASVVAPFFGGIIIKFFNFPVLFIIGSAFLFVAMVPLFLTKDVYEKAAFNQGRLFRDIFKKDNLPLIYSFAGYAVESWVGHIIWPIFLFIILFSTESVGAIVSLTTMLTIFILYFIGRITDKKDKKYVLKVGTILYFFGWAGRIFAQGLMSVLFIDTYKGITQRILYIPWSAYSYDLAVRGNYFKFIVQREIIFHIARVAVIPFLILIFAADFHPFIISFSIAAIFSLFFIAINHTEDPVMFDKKSKNIQSC